MKSLGCGGVEEGLVATSSIFEQIRRGRPLVHIISNWVTMGDVANATLAIGARPVMAHAPEEVEEITSAAQALVLNLGTPSRERVDAMLLAGKAANRQGIPILFDPVGVGASSFRQESAAHILNSLHISVLRGNAGEMGTFAGIAGTQSGVDTARADFDHAVVAQAVAAKFGTIVVVTGATDYVSDGTQVARVDNGHPLLQQISGSGDMLDVVIAACIAVETRIMLAAETGLLAFGIAAERAARPGAGLGSFRVALFDELGKLDPDTIRNQAKITMTNDP